MSLYAQPLLDLEDEIAVDLFAGGGGFSSGFEQATGRLVTIAINHDRAAVEMHKANHPQTIHYRADVFEVCPIVATQGRPVGYLHASPDCTYHSKARGEKPIRHENRKRRALVWVVRRWAGQTGARVISMENVEEFQHWGPLIAKRCPDTGRVVKIDGTVAAKGEHVPVREQALRPDPKRRGETFRKFIRFLREMGYVIEWCELRACDFGAPTIRKRWFCVARRDGRPIVWPEPTHGPGRPLPYRTAAECIDWSIPMCSIFASKDEAKAWGKAHGQAAPKRPLATNTKRRIARGVKRYVLESAKPFLVSLTQSDAAPLLMPITHQGERRTPPVDEPLPTITTANRSELAIVAPFLAPRYGERDGQAPRARSVEDPAPTVVTNGNGGSLVAASVSTFYGGPNGETRGVDLSEPLRTQGTENRFGVVASFLATNNGGFAEGNSGDGRPVDEPTATITGKGANHGLMGVSLIKQRGTSTDADPADPLDTVSAGGLHHGVAAAHLQRDFGQSVGSALDAPVGALTGAGGGKAGLVASFLAKYYGTGDGQAMSEPVHTVPTVDRFGFVTVAIGAETYAVVDIAMRMLQPKELYAAQGFRPGYVIDRGADGRALTKTEQVRMCGNSVCPPVAEAIVRANVPEMIVREIPKPSKRKEAKRAA